jgi:hypothetical protein
MMTTAARAQGQALDHKDYEAHWKPIHDAIQSSIQNETSLSRVLSLASRRGVVPPPISYKPVRFVSAGEVVHISAPGAGGIYGKILTKSLIDMTTDETDTIIELGSGWGSYLFALWLGGGPRNARYYAGEITEMGRACTSLLSMLESGISISPFRFDYYNPDYSAIKPGREAVVYTSHSIEQIPQLPREVFTEILKSADRVRGLHLEPIGWQVHRNIGTILPPFSEAQEARNHELEYNLNLWPLLLDLEAEGLIEIETVVTDIIGMEYNPSTLIRWNKRAQ